MITKVIHRDWGRDRTFGLLGAPIDPTRANAIGVALNQQHIPVAVSVDATRHVVHLWPWTPLTTEQEVAAMRAFFDVTDYRVNCHPAVKA